MGRPVSVQGVGQFPKLQGPKEAPAGRPGPCGGQQSWMPPAQTPGEAQAARPVLCRA